MTTREEIRVASRPVFAHSADAVRAGDLLFVAGVLPADEDGALVGADDVVAQAQHVFADLVTVLEAGGSSLADVVKVSVYLTDVTDRPLVNPIRQRVFGETRPASTLVEVSALAIPGAKIEVDCIALVRE